MTWNRCQNVSCDLSFTVNLNCNLERKLGYQSSYFQVFCKYIVVGNGSMFVELDMLNLNEVREFLIALCFVFEDYKSESWTFELNGEKFDDGKFSSQPKT